MAHCKLGYCLASEYFMREQYQLMWHDVLRVFEIFPQGLIYDKQNQQHSYFSNNLSVLKKKKKKIKKSCELSKFVC